jgi:AraC-like DNA-binding protein
MARGAILQEFADAGRYAGAIFYYNPLWIRPAHYHGQLELLILTRGELTFRVAGLVQTIAAPALVWHLPTLEHECVRGSYDCFFWIAMFEPDFAEQILSQMTKIRQRTSALTRNVEAGPFSQWIVGLASLVGATPAFQVPARLALRLEELSALAHHVEPAGVGFAPALGEILALAVAETVSQLSGAAPASLAELGTALLLAAPSLPRDVICRQLNVSSSYLARQFRERLGTTFVEYRTRARLVSFLAGAAQGHTTLLRAALDSGFGSYSQAHRAFSTTTGYCPRDYLFNGGRDERALVVVNEARVT